MKVFISDIHLGGGDQSDDFHRDDCFLEFLSWASKAEEIVILGDLYELWQTDLERIYWCHSEVIKKLEELKRKRKLTYIYGNHDYVPFSKIVPERYDIPGFLTAVHGHQFDMWNRHKNPLFGFKWPIGKWIALLVGELERWIHPDMDEWLEKMKDQFGEMKVESALIQNRKYDCRDLDQLRVVIQGLKEQNLAPISIFGHSHDAELVFTGENGGPRIYANCGSWVDAEYPTFVALTDKKIQLRDGNDYSVLEELNLSILGI